MMSQRGGSSVGSTGSGSGKGASGLLHERKPKDRYHVEYCVHNSEYAYQQELKSDSDYFYQGDMLHLTEQEFLEKREKKLKNKDGLTFSAVKLTANEREAGRKKAIAEKIDKKEIAKLTRLQTLAAEKLKREKTILFEHYLKEKAHQKKLASESSSLASSLANSLMSFKALADEKKPARSAKSAAVPRVARLGQVLEKRAKSNIELVRQKTAELKKPVAIEVAVPAPARQIQSAALKPRSGSSKLSANPRAKTASMARLQSIQFAFAYENLSDKLMNLAHNEHKKNADELNKTVKEKITTFRFFDDYDEYEDINYFEPKADPPAHGNSKLPGLAKKLDLLKIAKTEQGPVKTLNISDRFLEQNRKYIPYYLRKPLRPKTKGIYSVKNLERLRLLCELNRHVCTRHVGHRMAEMKSEMRGFDYETIEKELEEWRKKTPAAAAAQPPVPPPISASRMSHREIPPSPLPHSRLSRLSVVSETSNGEPKRRRASGVTTTMTHHHHPPPHPPSHPPSATQARSRATSARASSAKTDFNEEFDENDEIKLMGIDY